MNLLPYAVIIGTAGYAYEKISSYLDAKTYLPPGELIDVGDYKLHIQIQGEGREGVPTVIIETGIFDCSHSWQLVQPQIAEFTKVCTYDRAGYGWSQKGPCPRTFKQIVRELKILLETKDLKPPFIFVGHSLGGPLVRYYHSQYPEDVAGIIFVDALHDYVPQMSRIFLIAARIFSYLSVLGIPRLLFKLSPSFSSNLRWTPTMQRTYIAAHFAKPSSLTTCFDESDAMEESFTALRSKKKPLKGLPVTLISRDPHLPQRPGMSEEAIRKERYELEELHHKQRREMEHAKFIIAEGSSHVVQLDRPDLIIEEIKNMLVSLKDKK